MSDDLNDLDALFDQISSQHANAAPAADLHDAKPIAREPDLAPAAGAAQIKPATAPAAAADNDIDADDQGEKPMFERLGGIVRLLHDSLRELGYDRSLTDVASQISDAQGRLEYVASLTEQAANKVLNAIDQGMPAQDELAKNARAIEARWADLFAGKVGVDDFKTLAQDSQRFAAETVQAAETEKGRMLEIMMAQDFQDITGQLIKKIVIITTTAERELAQLLRDHAPAEHKQPATAPAADKPTELMAGPGLPGAAMVQDGVDDLLESLGF